MGMSSKLDCIKDWTPLIIKAHYRADELPAVAESSERNVRRVFKALFGRPTQAELDDRRGERAKAMLLSGCDEKTIIDQLGFRSIAHFSTWFKKRFHVSPSNFRGAPTQKVSVRECNSKPSQGGAATRRGFDQC